MALTPLKKSQLKALYQQSDPIATYGKGPLKKSDLAGFIQKMNEADNYKKLLAEDKTRQDQISKLQAEKDAKLDPWQRFTSLLGVAETGNAVHTGMEKKSVKEGVKQYLRDVGGNVSDTFTGMDRDQHLKNKKTYKDVLTDMGMKDRQGKLDLIDVAGFVGDVALDPTTYVGSGLIKGSVEVTAKTVAKSGAKSIVKGVVSREGKAAIDLAVLNAAKKGKSVVKARNAMTLSVLADPKYVGKSGVRFAGKTIIPQKALDAAHLHSVGTRGLTVGAKDAVLGLSEHVPVAGKMVKAGRRSFQEIFNPMVSRGLDKVEGGDMFLDFVKSIKQEIKHGKMTAAQGKNILLKEMTEAGVDPTKVGNLIETAGTRFKVAPRVADNIPVKGGVDIRPSSTIKDITQDRFVKEGIELTSSVDGKVMGYDDFVKEATRNKSKVAKELTETRQVYVYERIYNKEFKKYMSQGMSEDTAAKLADKTARVEVEATAGLYDDIFGTVLNDIKKAGTPAEKEKIYKLWLEKHFGKIPSANALKIKAINSEAMAKKLGREVSQNEVNAVKTYIRAIKSGDPEMLDNAVGLATEAYMKGEKVTRVLPNDLAKGEVQGLLIDLGLKNFTESIPVKTGNAIVDKYANDFIKELDDMLDKEMRLGLQMGKTKNYVPHVLSPEKLTQLLKNGSIDQETIQRLRTAMKSQNPRGWKDTIDNINQIYMDKLSKINAGRAKKGLEELPVIPLFDDNVARAIGLREQESIQAIEIAKKSNMFSEGWGINAEPMEKTTRTASGMKKTNEMITSKDVDGIHYRQVMTQDADGKTIPMREFEGVLLQDDVAKTIEYEFNFNKKPWEENTFIKNYDKVTQWFKSSVTVLFPSFHVRNYYSGLWNNALFDTKLSAYDTFYRKMWSNPTGHFITDKGQMITYKRLREQLHKLDVMDQTGQADIGEMMDMLAEQVGKNIDRAGKAKKNVAEKVLAGGGKVTQKVENSLRAPLFISEVMKGATFEDAAKTVIKAHFDYTPAGLTETETKIFKRIIPFYVWSRNNIPLQLEMLGRKPGMYTATSKIQYGGDRKAWNENRQNMSDSQRIAPTFRVGDKNLALDLPWGDIVKWLDPKQTASMINPIIKFPLEKMTNYNWYYGSQIKDKTLPKEDQVAGVKDVNPLAAVPFSNILQKFPVLGQLFDRNEDLPGPIKDYLNLKDDGDGNWTMDSGKAHTLNSFLGRLTTTTGKIADDSSRAMTNTDKWLQLVGGMGNVDTDKSAAGNYRRGILKQMPKEMQTEYSTLHVMREEETPLLASRRKATTYLDYPEFFEMDKKYYSMQKQKMGRNYDPIYDLSWEQAKEVFGQAAAGDEWNKDALEAKKWYTDFTGKRSEYYDAMKASSKKDINSESSEYYNEPSAYVQAQMSQKNWTDPAVQDWLTQNTSNKNNKRIAMGLITEEPQGKIKTGVIEGKADFKESTGKSLIYMQAIQMAGLDTYKNFFEENPELDPLKGADISGMKKKVYKKKVSIKKAKSKKIKMAKIPKTKKPKIKISATKLASARKKYKQIKMGG
jgi:hypothetical protein